MVKNKIANHKFNDGPIVWNNTFQQQDTSIKNARKNRTWHNKLTDAEKRKSRTYKRGA